MQMLPHLHIIRGCGVEMIEKVVVLFGRHTDVLPVRATLVRGEATSLFAQTRGCLMLPELRNAKRLLASRSLFG